MCKALRTIISAWFDGMQASSIHTEFRAHKQSQTFENNLMLYMVYGTCICIKFSFIYILRSLLVKTTDDFVKVLNIVRSFLHYTHTHTK